MMHYTFIRRILLSATLVVVFNSCSGLRGPAFRELGTLTKITATHVAYPIVLLHGLGQKSHVWDGGAISFYEKEMNLSFGGILSMKDGKAVLSSSNNAAKDFFTVSFTNPTDSVRAWADELQQYIASVRQHTGASKVILIGYSMGGIAARYYLTHHLSDHHVERLITIGSPHLGSPFARIWKLKTAITTKLKSNPNIITEAALKAALALLNSCESDVAFDSPALRDLMRPEDGGEFLEALGKAEHPADVDYVSVVGDVEVSAEVQKLNKTAVQEVLRRALELFDSGIGALFSDGDGVVSVQSQTLNNIPWFRNSTEHQRVSRTVNLRSLHAEHLKNSNEIQRVTLEDKPEFRGAEFYSKDGVPVLVVDFSDLLPHDKSIVRISYDGKTKRQSLAPSESFMFSGAGSEPANRAVFSLPDADFSKSFEINITVRNYFSNRFSVNKTWQAAE